jgi:V8-like Glu-specific endopeptidase
MPSLDLDPRQRIALNGVLADAFKVSEFDRMLLFHLNKEREEITLADDEVQRVFMVVEAAERQGWTAELVASALEANPGNAALRSFSADLGIGAAPAEGIHLERMVNPANGFIDFEIWSQSLLEIEGQVCRIELGNDSLGTGFIVGDSFVLTNRHVVQDVIADQALAKSLVLRFDYKRSRAGVEVHAGTPFVLDDDWLADERPHSPADTSAGSTEQPAADQLDYALLRVAADSSGSSIAGSPVGGRDGANPRGYLKVPVPPPTLAPDQPIVIVQHPNGEPLKLAIDTNAIIGVAESRVRYRTNTEPGSSGSPVLDGHLQLVALHHAGDPDYSDLHNAEYNQGIPIELVRNSIKDRTGLEVLA